MMKKIIFLCLATLALAVPSQAQVGFGVKGGLNLTEMSLNKSEMEDNISNKSGFFFGPTVKFTLPVVGLGIDVSALYDQREGKVKVNNADETLRQQTIQVPINVRYSFGLGDAASVFLFVGPQFGFNVGDKEKKLDFGEWSLKSSNLSGNAGLGLLLLNHLQATVSYNFALGKTGEVTLKENNVVKSNSEVKNNAWQISLAYYF